MDHRIITVNDAVQIERWAKIYNLKQMAAALQFLQENGLTDYDALAERTAAAVDRAHVLAGELREVEERLASTTKLMGAVVDYAKTRPVFDGYKAARYSKKYLAEHEEALSSYRAAKAVINDILDGAKLPRMEALKKGAPGAGGAEEKTLRSIPGGTTGNAGGGGGQGQHRPPPRPARRAGE